MKKNTAKPVNNSIFTIEVYKHGAMWVFDDARVGLDKEPFVAGADTLIDKIAGGSDKITIIFSTIPFPGHKLRVDRKNTKPVTGTDYYCEEYKHDLWLCPALNLYYPKSPDHVFIDCRIQKGMI